MYLPHLLQQPFFGLSKPFVVKSVSSGKTDGKTDSTAGISGLAMPLASWAKIILRLI